jgi:hypothetical protein
MLQGKYRRSTGEAGFNLSTAVGIELTDCKTKMLGRYIHIVTKDDGVNFTHRTKGLIMISWFVLPMSELLYGLLQTYADSESKAKLPI